MMETNILPIRFSMELVAKLQLVMMQSQSEGKRWFIDEYQGPISELSSRFNDLTYAKMLLRLALNEPKLPLGMQRHLTAFIDGVKTNTEQNPYEIPHYLLVELAEKMILSTKPPG
jgi:hypothetical protein